MRQNFGLIISIFFIAGIVLCISGIVGPSLPCGGIGIVCLFGSWISARGLSDVYSVNGIGSGFFGDVKTPEGDAFTMWLCFFFPLVPVRSFYIVGVAEVKTEYMLNQSSTTASYRLIPFGGLGFCWKSVGKTLFWNVVIIAGIVLVGYLVDKYAHKPSPRYY